MAASTRLSYALTGNYRGEVKGRPGRMVRVGPRYQVHLEVIIGASFAPLMTRRITSDGELGDSGLAPRRYDEEQRVVFRSRRARRCFEPSGSRCPRAARPRAAGRAGRRRASSCS